MDYRTATMLAFRESYRASAVKAAANSRAGVPTCGGCAGLRWKATCEELRADRLCPLRLVRDRLDMEAERGDSGRPQYR